MYILLSEAKEHLNLPSDEFTEDDALILRLIDVCEATIAKRINSPLDRCLTCDGQLDPTVKHSILLLIGSYYAQREGISYSTISEAPQGIEWLANLSKDYHNTTF